MLQDLGDQRQGDRKSDFEFTNYWNLVERVVTQSDETELHLPGIHSKIKRKGQVLPT